MDEDVRRPGRYRHPSLGDVALALSVATLTALRSDEIGYLSSRFESVGQWIAAALVFFVIALRRHAPALAIIAAALVDIAADLTGLTPLGSHVAWAVCVFTGFRYLPTRAALAVTIPSLLAELVAFASTEGWRFLTTTSAALLAATGLSIGISLALRSRDQLLEDSAERFALAEATRDAEVARQLAEDRLRTARDLHDTLAHHIAVINLNAGVGLGALPSDVAEATRSLTLIQSTARETITEIRDLLHDLRSGRPTLPRQDVGDIPRLVDRLRSSGMKIEYSTNGVGDALDPMTSALAYRLVLEAVTNALKHGDPRETTRVRVDGADEVEIVVVNTVSSPRESAAPGHGLAGMSEAVLAAGGRFHAGLDRSSFTVDARLPLTVRSTS